MTSKVSARTSCVWVGSRVHFQSSEDVTLLEFTCQSIVSTCAVVGSVIESKTSVVQASNVGFTSEVSDYLVAHTGPGQVIARAATPRQKLQKMRDVSLSRRILTRDQPGLSPTL